MGRKGENIYQRKDKRWEGRYVRGRKQNGKIHYGYVYGKSYSEVYQRLYPLKKKFADLCSQQGSYTGSLQEWLDTWISLIQDKVKPATVASYHYKIQKYVVPKIGTLSMNELTEKHLEELVGYYLHELKLAPATIKVIFTILNNALERAIAEGLLIKNVCQGIALPKIQTKGIKSLTKLQQKKLEAVAHARPNGLPTLLALHTGLRIGEISGLRWQDIQLEEQLIHVRSTYQRVARPGSGKTSLVLGETKTSTSNRFVPFSGRVRAWLEAWQQESKPQPEEFVFSKAGMPLEPRLLTYHFKKIAMEAGQADLHFHQLRHTFATRCLEAEGDVASISAMLGHASAKTTLDIYVDSLMEQRRKVIASMEKEMC